MSTNLLPENEFFPVSYDYQGYELERIWNVIQSVKRNSMKPHSFAKTIRDYYLGRFSGRRAPRRGGGEKLPITIIGERQLSKYYSWELGDAENTAQIETWRFLDIVSALIRREKNFQLDSSVFNYFNFRAAPIDHAIIKSGLTYYIRPLIDSNASRPGMFRIEGAEDEHHVKITLWISKANDIAEELVRRDILEENYQSLSRWDGLARLILPRGRASNNDRIFANHDVEVIMQEYIHKTPGSLSIGNRSVSANLNATTACLFRSPHGEVSYELEAFGTGVEL